MAREKSGVNPATAALKAQKNAAIKKNKASVAAQRTERLANRNPERLQKQIDELVQLRGASGGKLKPRDEQQLQHFERDLRLIRKARSVKDGDDRADRTRGRDGDGQDKQDKSTLGKRRRGEHDAHVQNHKAYESDSADTDPEVRDIPMPRDTPPPMPRRRDTRGEKDKGIPKVVSKITYGAAPQLRDFQKEVTSAFVPAAVLAKRKQAQKKMGPGELMEPEEMDEMERVQEVERERRRRRVQSGKGKEGGMDALVEEMEQGFEGYGGHVSGETRPHQAAVEDVEDEDLLGEQNSARDSGGGVQPLMEDVDVPMEEQPEPQQQQEQAEDSGSDVFSWD